MSLVDSPAREHGSSEPLSVPDGIVLVDKAEGPTSHDTVAAARKAWGTRRIGHTGTLDPFASGLLLLCVGRATRLAPYLSALPKTYRARMRLGAATNTDDLTGEPISPSADWSALGAEDVRKALAGQEGAIEQVPPLYSAKKVAGERMYAAARRGETPERRPVSVTIHEIRLLCCELPDAEFEVSCSSGTYVRAIARDVGDRLGVGAHLTALRRTHVGSHAVEDAVAFEDLHDRSAVCSGWRSPADAVAHLPMIRVKDEDLVPLKHGRPLELPPPVGGQEAEAAEGVPLRLLGPAGELVAIGERKGGTLRPRKVFA